tara:strand:+ start:146 stop:538 length:393 start_codon:yes stop_codon:yes gene_type:complete
MALPFLGIAARLILSSGARQAAKKYGKAAVKKAQEQINKHSAALDRKAAQATKAEGPTPSSIKYKTAQERARTQSSREGLRTRLDRQRTGRERIVDSEGNLIPEVPLRFATGGSIDGQAIQGLTKGSKRR